MTLSKFLHHWHCNQYRCRYKRKMVTGILWLIIAAVIALAIISG